LENFERLSCYSNTSSTGVRFTKKNSSVSKQGDHSYSLSSSSPTSIVTSVMSATRRHSAEDRALAYLAAGLESHLRHLSLPGSTYGEHGRECQRAHQAAGRRGSHGQVASESFRGIARTTASYCHRLCMHLYTKSPV
jgi:hypothetical protein